MSAKKETPTTCGATMPSMGQPGHVHVCGGHHDAGDHLCADRSCSRYFRSSAREK